MAFEIQIAQRLAQQPNLGNRMREINSAGAMSGIGSRQHQFAGKRESVVVRP